MIYTSANLSAVRRELLDAGCVPKLWQKNLHQIKAFQTSDETKIIEDDPLRGGIQAFCRHAGIPFEGQGLGAAAHGALERLLRPKRGHISAKLRREIVERQDGMCHLCGEPLGGGDRQGAGLPCGRRPAAAGNEE